MESAVYSSNYASQLYKLDSKLHDKLSGLRYKPFTKGHRVLLAKAISDTIVLPQSGIEDFNIWFLGEHINVMRVLDNVSYFVFVEDKESLIKLVRDFVQWRYSMVYNPPGVLAIRGEGNAIEELTGVLNFVDMSELSSVLDVYSDINYYYQMFRSISNVK